jgi:hypothetical protein
LIAGFFGSGKRNHLRLLYTYQTFCLSIRGAGYLTTRFARIKKMSQPTPPQPTAEERRKYVIILISISFVCSLGVGSTVVFLEKQGAFPRTDGHGRVEYLVVSNVLSLLGTKILIVISVCLVFRI